MITLADQRNELEEIFVDSVQTVKRMIKIRQKAMDRGNYSYND